MNVIGLSLAQQPPSIWPAIWSAIAATFSAVTAVLVLTIHCRNLIDSVPPEHLLTGWVNGGITFSANKIKNIGKCPAINVTPEFLVRENDNEPFRPTWSGFTVMPVVAPGQEEEIALTGFVNDRSPKVDEDPFVSDTPIKLLIQYSDLHGRLYELKYEMGVRWGPPLISLGFRNEVVDCLRLFNRSVRRVRRRDGWVARAKASSQEFMQRVFK